MYKSLTYSRVVASYYDRIYSWKPYAAESIAIKKLIREYKQSKGKDLLDVACGTGMHLQYLKGEFHCMGTDLSESMLVQARKNNPEIAFHRADMMRLNLHRQFDAIILYVLRNRLRQDVSESRKDSPQLLSPFKQRRGCSHRALVHKSRLS